MRKTVAFAVAGAIALAAIGGTTAFVAAQTNPPPAVEPTDKPLATVDGVPITEKDIALAYQEFQESLQQMPPDQIMSALVNGLVDIRLMARAAEAAGFGDDAEVKRAEQFARDRTLRGMYLSKIVFAGVTEEAIKKRYDEEAAKFVPGDEVRASHILVETEEEAKAIIAQLDQGGDFAAIAKEKSKDPGSAEKGGDLGFFAKGQMVPAFEQAAFALEVGQYTKTPVKSDFGFHIIRLDEKRKQEFPKIETVRPQIEEALRREAFFAAVDKLRKDVKIEMLTPPPAPVPETPPADAPATPPAQ